MTAARPRAKRGFPPTATSTVAKLPQWAVRPTLSHASTIPANAPSVPPDMRLNAERERWQEGGPHPPWTSESYST
jgi:hypothetical protein